MDGVDISLGNDLVDVAEAPDNAELITGLLETVWFLVAD